MTEQGFARIALLYAVPGQTPAFEAVLKERNALRKKHGITDGVDVAQLIIGRDGPAYAVIDRRQGRGRLLHREREGHAEDGRRVAGVAREERARWCAASSS